MKRAARAQTIASWLTISCNFSLARVHARIPEFVGGILYRLNFLGDGSDRLRYGEHDVDIRHRHKSARLSATSGRLFWSIGEIGINSPFPNYFPDELDD